MISGNLRSQPLASPAHTVAAALDEYIVKSPSFGSPISLIRDATKSATLGRISDSDVIHLHGINGVGKLQALVSRAPTARVVWTLHDMNAFTGTCHYSLGCSAFTASCSQCPAVRAVWRRSVENRLREKSSALESVPNLSIVAPSTWLAEQASQSSALSGRTITVIPNPVNPLIESSALTPRLPGEEPFRVVVVAQNLADPVKGVEFAVGAFRDVFGTTDHAELILVGNNGHHWASGRVLLTGPLGHEELSAVLQRSDVLLVPSLAENAPLVIAEAAVCGVVPIVRDVGGMREMVEILETGATFSTAEDLSNVLYTESLVNPKTRAARRAFIADKARHAFGVSAVVAAYDKVYGG